MAAHLRVFAPYAVYGVLILCAFLLLESLIGPLSAIAALVATCLLGTILTIGPLDLISRAAGRSVAIELERIRSGDPEIDSDEGWRPSARLLKALSDMPASEQASVLLDAARLSPAMRIELTEYVKQTLEGGRGTDEDRLRAVMAILADARA